MTQSLRVLVLEDKAAEAELAVRELRRAGFDPDWRRVDTRAAFEAALDDPFDIILADYRLPQFDGLEALRIVRERRLNVPLILVTGTLGEELAVECLKQGAADFVLKQHLNRLGPAVTRALDECRLRRENERAHADLRAAHARLLESESRYRSLFDHLLNGYARCRMVFEDGRPVDWTYLEVNPAFEALTGLRDVVGKRVTEVIPGITEMHSELLETYGRVARGGPPERFDIFVKPLGIWFSIAAYHSEDEHFIAVFENISERRRAEQALLESTETMKLILESTGEGIFGMDSEGRCTFINRSGAKAFGEKAEDILGKDMHAQTHHTRADGSPYRPEECPINLTCATGTPSRVDGELFWRSDGTSFPIGYSSYPIVKAGAVAGAVVTFADVTDKLNLEAQLRQAQKLEAIGQLTGGVAHDFNNLLTAILGYARLLEESIEPGDPRRDNVSEIRSAGEQAAHLTQQLLAFSRRQVLQPQVIDVNALVSDLAQMLRRLIGEHITLETKGTTDLSPIKVDPGQMQQVVMNLVVNARDAMPDGGMLTIDTANEIVDDGVARSHGVGPGAYVRVGVTDNGVGMDDATRARLFEPFFTTKLQGKGTGLGLSTVYGILTQSGGFICVSSTLSHGSKFDIYLPAATGGIPAERLRPSDTPARGTETVLLVEDEPSVRALARRLLERHGYRVVDMESAAVARAAINQATPIDLLLTDVLMPGCSGPVLYRELQVAHPGLKVVFMSGYLDESSRLHDVIDGHVFLQKPFDGERLVRKVREALDREG